MNVLNYEFIIAITQFWRAVGILLCQLSTFSEICEGYRCPEFAKTLCVLALGMPKFGYAF